MSSTYVDGVTPLDAAHMNALQQKVEKAVANGYPSLDATGKIPSAQLPPISSVDYAGQYNPATTYHAGEFVVGADGITYQCVKDGTVGISPVPWAPAPSIPYGTSLPASPVDGMEAVLVDSTTNPSYQWRFRYNAGSSSAYEWEFVGGVPLSSSYYADETLVLDTAWHEFPTPNAVTVPRSGIYRVYGQARFFLASSTRAELGVAVNGSNQGWFMDHYGSDAVSLSFDRPSAFTFTAAQVVSLQYQFTVAPSTAYGSQRVLAITPVKVS